MNGIFPVSLFSRSSGTVGPMNLHANRDRARLFYTLLGLAMAATILLGFSRTYYLKAWFDTPP